MVSSSTLIASVSKFSSLINKWALYLLLFIWPFGHLLKVGPIYLLDVSAFLVFLSYFFQLNEKNKPKPLLLKVLFFYWFTLLTSIFINFKQQEIVSLADNFLYYLRAFSYPFIALSFQKQSSKDLKSIFSYSVLVFIFLSLAQYFFLPDLRLYKNLGFDDHYYRLAGPLLDPNFAGAILASLSIFFLTRKKYLISFVCLACLALTFSRASYLSFLVALPLSLFRVSKKVVFLAIASLVVLILLSPKPFGEGVNLLRTYSISSRIESISTGLSLFASKPFFGQGFGLITDNFGHKVSIDNSYVYLLAGSGVFGLLALLFLLYTVAKSISFVGFASLIPLLVHSFFNNSFYYIWIAALFWLLVGESLKENKST